LDLDQNQSTAGGVGRSIKSKTVTCKYLQGCKSQISLQYKYWTLSFGSARVLQ